MGSTFLIAALLGGIAEGIPQVPVYLKNIIRALVGTLGSLSQSGVTTGLNPQTFLAALAGVIQALKAVPEIPADKLLLIADLENALVAAMAADKQASQQVDPGQLHPIDPLP